MNDLELREAVAVEVMGYKAMKRTGDTWPGIWLFPPDFDGSVADQHGYPVGKFEEIEYPGYKRTHGFAHYKVPTYESDIAAAWLVVERMAALYPEWNSTPDAWRHLALRTDLLLMGGKEVATAICRAALAAVRAENQ